MRTVRQPLCLFVILVGYLACASTPCRACSVPVFRYALERWPADPFEVILFHRGQLTEKQQKFLDILSADGYAGKQGANVRVVAVDLDSKPNDELLALWASLKATEVPWLVLLYPYTTGIQTPIWSGPFREVDDDFVRRLLHSPVRREIVKRLIQDQDSAVWLFLDGGDKKRDDAAFALLEKTLKEVTPKLKLPEIKESDLRDLSIDPRDLRIKFSTIRLSADSPAEKMLVAMLLASEKDLRELHAKKQPMVFPVFGRGRSMLAIIGGGINKQVIAKTCSDLTGPCTCEIKDQNPGFDLLISARWQDLLAGQPQFVKDPEPPPLTSIATMLPAPKEPVAPIKVQVDHTASLVLRDLALSIVCGLAIVGATAFVLRFNRAT
ncbi:MAG: hypothetical protein KatS3mg105_1278 [Gemmatales bacterium]|nr:MAG: hypothetical protein KatS3mg105_1278 [Gemmatales bacterium]